MPVMIRRGPPTPVPIATTELELKVLGAIAALVLGGAVLKALSALLAVVPMIFELRRPDGSLNTSEFKRRIDDIIELADDGFFGLAGARLDELEEAVEHPVEVLTEGDWGREEWIPVRAYLERAMGVRVDDRQRVIDVH